MALLHSFVTSYFKYSFLYCVSLLQSTEKLLCLFTFLGKNVFVPEVVLKYLPITLGPDCPEPDDSWTFSSQWWPPFISQHQAGPIKWNLHGIFRPVQRALAVMALGEVCPRVLATLPRSPDRDPEAGARLARPQHEVGWGGQRVGSVTTSVSSCQESDEAWSGDREDWSIIRVQSVQLKKGRSQPRATWWTWNVVKRTIVCSRKWKGSSFRRNVAHWKV